MESNVIQRQYDDVIAKHYDQDPQSVTQGSLNRAKDQLGNEGVLQAFLPPLKVLDLGMGTGLFLDNLRQFSSREIQPHGLDISSGMVELAQQKLPDLVAHVDDAANLEDYFQDKLFELISTHLVTGFVPIAHLAPRIHAKLADGGYWSFVGGTSAGYPECQKKANNRVLQFLFGGKKAQFEGLICPEDESEVVSTMKQAGFKIVDSVVFRPGLWFGNYDEFMEYAYHGGWLTPFVEEIGLQNAGRTVQGILNKFVFPVRDHHEIVITLARKE